MVNNSKRQSLHCNAEERKDQCSEPGKIVKLDDELANPVGQSARHSNTTEEVISREQKQLVLLLVVKRLRIADKPKKE